MPDTKQRTLLTISDDLQALDDLLFELGGDVTGQESAIDKFLAELGQERDRKLDNYAALIREIEMRRTVRKAELEQLEMRNRTDENTIKSMKERLKMFFEQQKLGKITTGRYTLALQTNGGKVSMEMPQQAETVLPPKYIKMVPQVRTDELREDLEKGVEVPGCKLLERGKHLSIR